MKTKKTGFRRNLSGKYFVLILNQLNHQPGIGFFNFY